MRNRTIVSFSAWLSAAFFCMMGMFGEGLGTGAYAVEFRPRSDRDPSSLSGQYATPAKAGEPAAAPAIESPRKETARRPVLTGWVWDCDLPSAVLDGHVVRLGEEVNDGKVVYIGKEGVKISRGEETVLLKGRE